MRDERREKRDERREKDARKRCESSTVPGAVMAHAPVQYHPEDLLPVIFGLFMVFFGAFGALLREYCVWCSV